MNDNDKNLGSEEVVSKFSKFSKPDETPSTPPQPVIEETPIQPTKASESPKPMPPDTPEEKPLTLKSSPPPNIKKSPFRITTSLIMVTIIVALGYFGYSYLKPSETINPEPSPLNTPPPSPDPFENYNTHVTSSYTVRYPRDLSASIAPGNVLILTKYGPTQADQTEFFDGISITIEEISLEEKTLLEYVEGDVDQILSSDEAEITSSIEEVTYGENSGYKFTAENLIKFTKIFLTKESGSAVLEVTDSSIDPGNLGFQNIVNSIIESITFTSSSSPVESPSFTCPETEYIDCMPTTDPEGVDDRCDEDYLTWAAENCDGFKGPAY